jgi:hypothetical protein
MGHTNFPLVVFDQEPPHMAGPEGDVSTSPMCDGLRCLAGSRKSEASSQWYPPPLLDAVPKLPGLLEERVSFNHRLGSGSSSSEGDSNDSRAGDDTERERQTYGEARLGKWGIIGFAATVLVALTKIFIGSRQPPESIQPVLSSKEIGTVVDWEKPVSQSDLTPFSPPPPSRPPAIKVARSPEPDLIPPSPKPEGLTRRPQDPNLKSQLLPVEHPGEPEDGDESEKEGPSDMPRKKGRRRKRGKKKKTEAVEPEADADEDEDDFVTKDVPNETPVVPPSPALSVLVPSPPSSLLVSDTVLGV